MRESRTRMIVTSGLIPECGGKSYIVCSSASFHTRHTWRPCTHESRDLSRRSPHSFPWAVLLRTAVRSRAIPETTLTSQIREQTFAHEARTSRSHTYIPYSRHREVRVEAVACAGVTAQCGAESRRSLNSILNGPY